MESFRAASHKFLSSWDDSKLEKWHLPALSPPKRAPSDSCLSSTLPKAIKPSFKLLPSVLGLRGVERACQYPTSGDLAPHRLPTLPDISSINLQSPMCRDLSSKSRSPGPGVLSSSAFFCLSNPLLFPSCLGLEQGEGLDPS